MQRQILCQVEEPIFSKIKVAEQNWSKLYPDAKKELPLSMPTPKGKFIRIRNYYDAGCTHDLEARKPVTDIMISLDKITIQ